MNILQWCFRKAEQCSVFLISNMRMAATLYSTSNVTVDDRRAISSGPGAGSSSSTEAGNTHTFLVVGLGNHGFPKTRHSVGMKAVDRLAVKLGVPWEQSIKQNGGFVSYAVLGDDDDEKASTKLVLFKPKALMNINGVSVAKTAKLLAIPPRNIFLIHDELDRNTGKFQIKEGGSAGGHNGVLSCMNSLRSDEMLRLRIGISRPASKSLVASYVLSDFSQSELAVVDVAIDQALDSLLDYIKRKVKPNNPDLVTKGKQQRTGNAGKKSRRQKGNLALEEATTKKDSDSQRLSCDGGNSNTDLSSPAQVSVASDYSEKEEGKYSSHDESLAGKSQSEKEKTPNLSGRASRSAQGGKSDKSDFDDDSVVDR